MLKDQRFVRVIDDLHPYAQKFSFSAMLSFEPSCTTRYLGFSAFTRMRGRAFGMRHDPATTGFT
jgi:hypothetical protein